jgi:putative ABC transport system permease protein
MPVLFSVSLALIVLHIVPVLVGLISRASDRILGLSASLAMRQISRQPSYYHLVIFLLMVTVALGLFSASFAIALDDHYSDASYYKVGTDLLIQVRWEETEGQSTSNETLTPQSSLLSDGIQNMTDVNLLLQEQLARAKAQEAEGEALLRWRYPPFEVVRTIPGLEAAARVFRTQAYLEGAMGRTDGTLLGIDRADFGQAAWWRRDFAVEPLGTLMNALAQDPASVLVSRAFAQETGLQEGNEVFLVVEGAGRPLYFVIKEVVDFFPTLYPDRGHFFIGNLDYIYDTIGILPYDIWVKLADGAASSEIVETLRQRGFLITSANDTRIEVASWRIAPQSTALSGMLSIGFIVGIVISGLGFFLSSFLSLRQRLPYFGFLRALGLSIKQLTSIVVFEELLLGLVGVIGGTLINALTSRLFIPLLKVATVTQETAPPLLVTPVWDQMLTVYVIFSFMMLVTLSILIWQLNRLRIYEALKLGAME